MFNYNSSIGTSHQNTLCDIDGLSFENEEILLNFSKNYDVQHVLGTGASGVVRKCIERATKKPFAVKIIDLVGVEDENDKFCLEESTLREISVLKQMERHPNIVELHDAFAGSTHILLVFELCKQELFDLLMEVVTLPETRIRHMMKQLFTAVEFIHSRNIVHRDIKAENILIDNHHNIKLSDFGFASVLEHDEQLTDLCGTFEYLSPEIMMNQLNSNYPGYGRSVDMWASGVLIYLMMYGVPPFWAPDKTTVLKNIIRGNFAFQEQRHKDFSASSRDLISKLLLVDPKKRLTASEALRHDFFVDKNVKDKSLSHVVNKLVTTNQKRARLRLKAAILAVQAVVFLQRLVLQTTTPLHQIAVDPYSSRLFRRLIDFGAFKIYGHWVTRDPTQSRALLFQDSKLKGGRKKPGPS